MDLRTVLRDGLNQEGFAELLRVVELSQADLARLGDFTRGTVNTWCSTTRKDRKRAPRHAIVLVLIFSMLTPEQRAALREASHG